MNQPHDNRSPAAARAPIRRGRRAGRRLSRHGLNGPETVEAYLRGSSPPRYMQRMREIENEFRSQRRRLEAAYRALEEACAGDAALFRDRWHARARAWQFRHLNELVREHNAWYPVEADLPMDPRTRDYVPILGASYRRVELGAEWVLEHFPPTPTAPGAMPPIPLRAPREPL